jgi:predicted MFS family arabinose efflux permease
MMRAILMSLASLMGATFLVQASNKAITTLIGVTIAERDGTQSDVALIAACYSIGFLVGCILSPSMVPRIGLIRAFTAAAALLTISIIALDLFDSVSARALLR